MSEKAVRFVDELGWDAVMHAPLFLSCQGRNVEMYDGNYAAGLDNCGEVS